MQSLPQSDIQKCQNPILTCIKVFHQSLIIVMSCCYSLVEMALNEEKVYTKPPKRDKIICDKLVDSQIELNSSEFWFCFEVKLTENFAYFVVSANLSKHTMHHQHKLGRVHFREKKLSKYQNIIEHTPQHQSLSSSPLQPACVWWRPFLIC